MHLSLINPYIRISMESKISSGSNIARRVIYDYEIIYLERGEFTLIYDEEQYICSPGDIIFIRPGIPHSFQIDRGEISQPHIHFDITYRHLSEKIPISFKDYGQMTEAEKAWIHKDYFSSFPRTPFITVQDKSEFLNCFYRIICKGDSAAVKKGLMIQLIATVINDNFKDIMNEQENCLIEHQIKDYIDAGNGKSMTLDNFSDTFFYSKFHLEKRFKAAFGLGIIEYRNKKRMEFAQELLRDNSITRVAQLLGYNSIYSFSRAYKSYYGYAPSKEYKAMP